MKALFFNEKGKAEEVLQCGNIDEPDLLPGELKIKMLASPINPADFMFIEKQYRVQPRFPQIAGFEGPAWLRIMEVTMIIRLMV